MSKTIIQSYDDFLSFYRHFTLTEEETTAQMYWDYRDTIEDFSPYYNGKYFDELLVYDSISELNYEYIGQLESELADELIEKYFIIDNEDEYDEIHENIKETLLMDVIGVDLDLDTLTGRSQVRLNLFPNQDDNLDQEGGELGQFLFQLDLYLEYQENPDAFMEEYVEDDDDVRSRYWNGSLEELKDTPNDAPEIITDLFKSQGYTLDDLANNEKYEASKFLKSFYRELYNRMMYYSQFLVVMIQTDGTSFFEWERHKHEDLSDIKITLTPSYQQNASIGFYDAVNGSGSLLEIELEKPFTFSYNHSEIQVEESQTGNYGWRVDKVYGLVHSAWGRQFEVELTEKQPIIEDTRDVALTQEDLYLLDRGIDYLMDSGYIDFSFMANDTEEEEAIALTQTNEKLKRIKTHLQGKDEKHDS